MATPLNSAAAILSKDSKEPRFVRFFDVGYDTPGRSCMNCVRPLSCEVTKDCGSRCINWRAQIVETMMLPGFDVDVTRGD